MGATQELDDVSRDRARELADVIATRWLTKQYSGYQNRAICVNIVSMDGYIVTSEMDEIVGVTYICYIDVVTSIS